MRVHVVKLTRYWARNFSSDSRRDYDGMEYFHNAFAGTIGVPGESSSRYRYVQAVSDHLQPLMSVPVVHPKDHNPS